MHTNRPTTLDDTVMRRLTNPPMVEELGRVASLDSKMRIYVKGEVTNVSCCDILKDMNITYNGSN